MQTTPIQLKKSSRDDGCICDEQSCVTCVPNIECLLTVRASDDLLQKIPACIWAPWRFVLHEHLPPSHMTSIKPTIIISIQKSVRLTGTLAVLNSSGLKHTHVINKSATCPLQHMSLCIYLECTHPLMWGPFAFRVTRVLFFTTC